MKLAIPVNIGAAQMVASNVVEQLPLATSGITYSQWNAATSYSVSNQVCWIYTGPNPVPGNYSFDDKGTFFALYTAKASPNINREPSKVKADSGSTLPGSTLWTANAYALAWDATRTYAAGEVVGRISAGIGAFYQSLQGSNVNHDPVSASTWWKAVAPAGSVNEWSGATTYPSGEMVCVTSGSISGVFTSLQAANLNHNPASSPTWWRYEGDSYKEWSGGTTYAVKDTVLDLRTHHVYESVQGSNTNHDPIFDTTATWWLDLGFTNRWAMFDTVTGSQSVYAETIDVTIAPGELCDTLALMNMEASSVQVTVTHGVSTVYDKTFDLTDPSFINDWYSYFFDALTFKSELIVLDLPPYLDAQIRIRANLPGGIAKVGNTIFGMAETLGTSLVGSDAGIRDYSRKTFDDFGTPSFVERGFAKTAQVQILAEADQFSAVMQRLGERRAKPSLWIGTANFAAFWVFGIPRDFRGAMSAFNVPLINLELDGLV